MPPAFTVIVRPVGGTYVVFSVACGNEGADGNCGEDDTAVTESDAVADLPEITAMTVAQPAETAVTVPVADIDAINAPEEMLQVTGLPAAGLPDASRATAVACVVNPESAKRKRG